MNTILNDVENQKSGHPQVIIIHCGTNDLTTTTPVEELISNISASISQASIKFPKSKIIYSTLLPRADIPLNTLSKINRKLIYSCSKLVCSKQYVHFACTQRNFTKTSHRGCTKYLIPSGKLLVATVQE